MSVRESVFVCLCVHYTHTHTHTHTHAHTRAHTHAHTHIHRVMGAAPAQNVYVTNNHPNAITTNHPDISPATSSSSSPYTAILPPPAPLPPPDMWPLGGVFADHVLVYLDVSRDTVPAPGFANVTIRYSTNVTGTQGAAEAYATPFELGPGWTKVEAVAEAAGESGFGSGGAGEAAHNPTSPSNAVKAAVFEVLRCDGDRYFLYFFY